MDRELLAQQLCALPIVQYEFFETSDLLFSDRVRHICRTECPQYGKSWACPPGVGTLEACRERCLRYPHALLITTMAETCDIADIAATLATRAPRPSLAAPHRAPPEPRSDEVPIRRRCRVFF